MPQLLCSCIMGLFLLLHVHACLVLPEVQQDEKGKQRKVGIRGDGFMNVRELGPPRATLLHQSLLIQRGYPPKPLGKPEVTDRSKSCMQVQQSTNSQPEPHPSLPIPNRKVSCVDRQGRIYQERCSQMLQGSCLFVLVTWLA